MTTKKTQTKTKVAETQSQKVDRVASYIISQDGHYYKSILGERYDEVLVYDSLKGIYCDDQCKYIKTRVEEILGSQWTTHLQSEIIAKIAIKTAVERSEFDVYPNLLCVANSILDMDTGKKMAHSPNTLFRRYVNASYDPDATCPRFHEYLKQVVVPQDAELLKQFMGYLLIPRQPYKTAFILKGEKHAGKTTFMRMLQAFVGEEHYSSLTLHQIGRDPALVPSLVGMIANISPEMSSDSLPDMSLLKSLTGGDTITARGIYSDPIKFACGAKMIFSCNSVPSAPSADDAYRDRFIVIPFIHSFIKGDTATSNYDELLTTPEELSGILNLAIGYRGKLLVKDGFSWWDSSPHGRNTYNWHTGDSVLQFIAMRLLMSPRESCAKSRVFEEYLKFCDKHELASYDVNVFWLKVKATLQEQILEFKGKKDKDLEYGEELGEERRRIMRIRGITFNPSY